MRNSYFNQKGALPLIVLIAVVGLIAFMGITSTFSFKSDIFSQLFKKESSYASAPVTPAPVPTPDPNLVKNPGCDVDITNWVAIGGTLSRNTSQSHSGAASCQVNLGIIGGSYGMKEASSATKRYPKQGAKYTATAWVKANNSSTINKPVKLILKQSGGSTATGTANGTTIKLSDSWQQITASIVINANDRSDIEISAIQTSVSAGNSFLIDDIILLEVLPTNYYIETLPIPGILMGVNTDYAVMALLKDLNGNVITNQADYVYDWSVDTIGSAQLTVSPFSICTYGIQPPCPNDHATIRALSSGANYVNVKVTGKASSNAQALVASSRFSIEVPQVPVVTSNVLYPDGGESFQVGQKITVRWEIATEVDYFNVYFHYYENGFSKGGYAGSVYYPTKEIDWVIPQELAGKQVKIVVDSSKGGYVVSKNPSDNPFTVK